MSRESWWLRPGDVVCLFTFCGLFYFWKLCLGKREQGTSLCLFIPGMMCDMGLIPAWRAAVLCWEGLRCRAAPLSSHSEGKGSTLEWGALIPTEAERGMKRDEVYPCLPPCMFTWERQYLSQTLSFASGTPAVFMFLLLQHLICFGLFFLSRLRRFSVLVFLLCSLEREGVGSSISQLALTQDLSHKSEHQTVFAVEAGLFFHYPPYYQIHCSQAKCGERLPC